MVDPSDDDTTRIGLLLAGRDYPRTYREFVGMFAHEEACRTYLEHLRWPAAFACPTCGASGVPWRQTRGRLVCSACRHQTSVGAGTILDKTRTPLTTWFEAAWHLTTAKTVCRRRPSNARWARATEWPGRCSSATGWRWCEPSASRCRAPSRWMRALSEASTAAGSRGARARKSVVAIAVEVKDPKGFGRVRMRHVPDASGASLVPFVCDAVAPGAVVHTDGWKGYNDLPKHGYVRQKTVLASSDDPAHVAMPGHRVASLLKRWILGTHQGSVDPSHLQSYLEEFTFRFNRRTSRSCGLVFRRLLEQAVVTAPLPEAAVTHGYDW